MEVEAKRLEEPGAVDDTKETASPGHNRTDTHMMNSGTGTAHTHLHRCKPDKIQALGRESEHKALPITKKLLETAVPQTPAKRKSTLSALRVSLGLFPFFKGDPVPGSTSPHKADSTGFLVWFGFAIIFCLNDFLYAFVCLF